MTSLWGIWDVTARALEAACVILAMAAAAWTFIQGHAALRTLCVLDARREQRESKIRAVLRQRAMPNLWPAMIAVLFVPLLLRIQPVSVIPTLLAFGLACWAAIRRFAPNAA